MASQCQWDPQRRLTSGARNIELQIARPAGAGRAEIPATTSRGFPDTERVTGRTPTSDWALHHKTLKIDSDNTQDSLRTRIG